jgi:hypothetical protein
LSITVIMITAGEELRDALALAEEALYAAKAARRD